MKNKVKCSESKQKYTTFNEQQTFWAKKLAKKITLPKYCNILSLWFLTINSCTDFYTIILELSVYTLNIYMHLFPINPTFKLVNPLHENNPNTVFS